MTLDSLPERIRSKIRVDCGHWMWTAAASGPAQRQYGAIKYGKRVRKAHVVIWEMLVGPVPEGLDLDHLCEHKLCVNPNHLRPATRRENSIRGRNKDDDASLLAYPCGHPRTAENTYRSRSKGFEHRWCRLCGVAASRRCRGRARAEGGDTDAEGRQEGVSVHEEG